MNKPKRSSTQISLWQPGVWQCIDIRWNRQLHNAINTAVFSVDAAIRRMMEQKK